MTIKTSDNISRTLPIVLCIIAVLGCFLYAYLRPNLPHWWKQVGGGVPYVLFWIFLWFVAFPNRKSIMPICIGVVLFTTLLEFLQLWNPEPLAALRQTKFGAAWMGSQFSWADIPPYFIGASGGFLVIHLLLYFKGKKEVNIDNPD